jgi:AcrR family transcriptional regulator
MTLTTRGAATRGRIVEAAADLVLARGVGGTSLGDILKDTGTSKGQLFHYFPGGKGELVAAIAELQGERVLEAQRPYLDRLDTWQDWQSWRDALVRHYGSQAHWGCPIGALASELIGSDPERGAAVADYMFRWEALLRAGLDRMRSDGELRPDAETSWLATAVFASLQGGLLLMQTAGSIAPLETALDAALATLRAAAPAPQEPSP